MGKYDLTIADIKNNANRFLSYIYATARKMCIRDRPNRPPVRPPMPGPRPPFPGGPNPGPRPPIRCV